MNIPDPELFEAKNHPTMSILFPCMDNVRTYHVGAYIMPDKPIISGHDGPAKSTYFKRCTGNYTNALKEAVTVHQSVKRVKIRDMKRVPVVSGAVPANVNVEMSGTTPFKMRYAMSVLMGWGMGNNEVLKETARRRILNEAGNEPGAKCSSGGHGVQAGMVNPVEEVGS